MLVVRRSDGDIDGVVLDSAPSHVWQLFCVGGGGDGAVVVAIGWCWWRCQVVATTME